MKLNPDALRQLEGDVGAELLPTIMRQFREEMLERCASLVYAIEGADLELVQTEAHTLKSSAKTLGLDSLATAAARTEAAARGGDALQAGDEGRVLLDLCKQAAVALEAEI